MDQNTLLMVAAAWLLGVLVKSFIERAEKKKLDGIDEIQRLWQERRQETDRRLEEVETALKDKINEKDCQKSHEAISKVSDSCIRLTENHKRAIIIHTHDSSGRADLKEVVL